MSAGVPALSQELSRPTEDHSACRTSVVTFDTFISQVLTHKEPENYCTTLELGNIISLPASYRQLIKMPAFLSFLGETEVLHRCKKTECQGYLMASKPDRDTAHSDILASLLQTLSPRIRHVHHALMPPPQPPPQPQPTRAAPRLGDTGGRTPSRERFSGVFPRERTGEGPPSICHGKSGDAPEPLPPPDTDPPHPATPLRLAPAPATPCSPRVCRSRTGIPRRAPLHPLTLLTP